jgi:CDP-glucose 4,6-dehydratase
MVEKIVEIWGEKACWEMDEGFHPYEAHILKLDCSKAKLRLGWLPQWDLETALKNTIEWYQAYRHHEDMFLKTMNQIKDYEEGIKKRR